MRLFTFSELLRKPHAELRAIKQEIEAHLQEHTCDRLIALANLGLIERVLSREHGLAR